MTLQKKFVSYFVWTFVAFSIGISISFITIRGGEIVFGAIYDKTQELIFKDTEIVSQNTLVEIPVSSEELINSVATFKTFSDSLETKNTISIGFVGDIIPGVNVSPNIFSEIILYTQKPDIMIGNFEGVATKNTYFKCKTDSKNCFSFNGDRNFLNLLSDASFDILNVANNHFNDYGQIGQEETLQQMQETGIVPSGIKNEITYIKRNNLKIGIVGFSNYSWTSNLNNTEKVQELVSVANQNSDIVIIIFHGGGEGAKYSHTPNETEWYLDENRGNLRSFSHDAIDAGADIVLGSGPHVLRGIEWYNDKLIAYSLGNFSTSDKLLTPSAPKTSAMLEVTLDHKASFVSGAIFPIEIDKYGTPHPDLNNIAVDTINDLSKSDFGEQGVILNSDGKIQIE